MKEKELKGTPIHYFTNDSSDARSLLLLHPAFADHTIFDEQVAHFKDTCRILIPDLIGHGASAAEGPLSEMTQWILRMMDEEGVEKADIVGFSLGAIIAQDFANCNPDRVSSLFCVSGFDINHFEMKMFMSQDSILGKISGIAAVPKKKFAREFKKDMARTPEAQERFYEMNMRYEKKYSGALFSLGKVMNKHDVGTRPYPLFIGFGGEDKEELKKASLTWHDAESDSRLIEFPEAGHLVNLDTPEAFNQKLEEVLQLSEPGRKE